MLGNAWRVGRVAGIEIRIDSSWLVIAVLIGYSFYVRFDSLYAELGPAEGALLAAVAALVFFSSVLGHELAHSITATSRGIPVKGITLFLLGGVTQARVESKSARDEFFITIVGPLSSLFFGALLWGASTLAGPSDQAIPGVLGYLAWVNVGLAIFNLLPGFPLDGGRVLRSAIWGATGNFERATRVAVTAGRTIGYLLAALGLISIVSGQFGGLWLVLLGWFIAQGAGANLTQLQIERALTGVHADDLMARDLVEIPADLSVADAIDEYFMRYDHSAFPVTDQARTVGLLTLRQVRRVPSDDRAARRVTDCMSPVGDLDTVSPHTPMTAVLTRFEDQELNRVLVVDGPRVVGIITPNDVARWIRRSEALRGQPTMRTANPK